MSGTGQYGVPVPFKQRSPDPDAGTARPPGQDYRRLRGHRPVGVECGLEQGNAVGRRGRGLGGVGRACGVPAQNGQGQGDQQDPGLPRQPVQRGSRWVRSAVERLPPAAWLVLLRKSPPAEEDMSRQFWL